MSINHPEPEVAELARWAQDDDDIGLMVHRFLRHEGFVNLTQAFDAKPAMVFELHEEAALLRAQLPTDAAGPSVEDMMRLMDES